MDSLVEFATWLALVAAVLGGVPFFLRWLEEGSTARGARRRLVRTERRVRRMHAITARYERLHVEQRSVEARQAALESDDVVRLAVLQQICLGLGPKADAERHAPGSTALESDAEALLDAAASLGDEYSRSASLAHVIELYVRAGLYDKAHSQARWVTDATVRSRLTSDPALGPLLRRDGPSPLLLKAVIPGGETPRPESTG